MSADVLEEIAAELDALSRVIFLKLAKGHRHLKSNEALRDVLTEVGHAGDRMSRIRDVLALVRCRLVAQADGGGFIRAAQKPVIGRERVAKYITAVSEWGWTGVTVTVIQANGTACAVLSRAGVVAMLGTIEASPEGIDRIIWMMRPSKLTGVAPAG